MTEPPSTNRTDEEILASIRAGSDVEVAITLLLFAKAYVDATGQRCLIAEVAAERLMERPG